MALSPLQVPSSPYDPLPTRRRVVALVPDLLLGVRIQEASRRIGAEVESVSSQEEALSRIASGTLLLIVDLALDGLDLRALADASRQAGISVLAFGPHVDVRRRKAALEAGLEHVYARSKFLNDLPKLLGQHVKST